MQIKELSNLRIKCEHKADKNHVAVSAASILAKDAREKEVAKLKEKHGDIGSGYPSDPKTIDALKQWIKNKNIPFFVRKSWHTFVKMRDLQKNAKITQLFDVRGER